MSIISSDKSVQYAVLPYRVHPVTGDIEFLLVTTRNANPQWLFIKGRAELYKNGRPVPPHRVVKKEARTEAGVPVKAVKIEKDCLGKVPYLKHEEDGTIIPCDLQVHLMQVPYKAVFTKSKEAGQRRIEWLLLREATRRLSANTNIPVEGKSTINQIFEAAFEKIIPFHAMPLPAANRLARKKKKPASADPSPCPF